MTSIHASELQSKSATKIKPMSATRRKSLATQQLLNAIAGTDSAAAITAALEVVNEWLVSDTAVKKSLRQKYEEIESLTTSQQKPNISPMPTPIPRPGRGLDSYNPYSKLDPYRLLENYGSDQLRAVLEHATQRLLREAVDVVQKHAPGTKPRSRSRNADMIDYIVEHVAGTGY